MSNRNTETEYTSVGDLLRIVAGSTISPYFFRDFLLAVKDIDAEPSLSIKIKQALTSVSESLYEDEEGFLIVLFKEFINLVLTFPTALVAAYVVYDIPSESTPTITEGFLFVVLLTLFLSHITPFLSGSLMAIWKKLDSIEIGKSED